MPKRQDCQPKRRLSTRVKNNANHTPLFVVFFFFHAILGGAIAAALIFIPYIEHSDNWMIGLVTGVPAFGSAILMLAFSNRVNVLTEILQQDPLVIVGDPFALKKLKKLPWYGTKELDQLQQAVLNTYLAYREDAPHGGISHGTVFDDGGMAGKSRARSGPSALVSAEAEGQGGASYSPDEDDFDDDVSFKSAESLDKEHIDTFLLQHYRNQKKRRFSFGGSSTGSRSPRTADFDGYGNVRSSDLHSVVSRAETIDNRSVNSLLDPQGQVAGRHLYGATSTSATAGLTTRSDSGAVVRVDNEGFPGPVEDPLQDNHSSWEEVVQGGVTDPGKSVIMQLISQVRPGQSLTAVTLPFHILEPRSMLERISDVFMHTELLLPLSLAVPAHAVGRAATPLTGQQVDLARRFSFFHGEEETSRGGGDQPQNPYWKLLTVFRWFISAYHLKPKGSKKPYNSVLGEALKLAFNSEVFGGHCKTTYVAEQVCHHPPVSCFYAEGCGVSVQSTYYPKSKLVSPNCAAAAGEGSILITVLATQEKFSLTWPTPYVSGFLTGNSRMEIGGHVMVTDLQTKEALKVDFMRKGYFSGSYDMLEGVVYDANGKKQDTHKVQGLWHGAITYTNSTPGPGCPPRVLWDSKLVTSPRPMALPLYLLNKDGDGGGGQAGGESYPKQTRYVWRHLTKALREDNPEAAAPAKHAVEQVQRAERKVMADAGRKHTPQYFKWVGKGNLDEKGCAPLHEVEHWEFIGQSQLD